MMDHKVIGTGFFTTTSTTTTCSSIGIKFETSSSVAFDSIPMVHVIVIGEDLSTSLTNRFASLFLLQPELSLLLSVNFCGLVDCGGCDSWDS